MPGLLEISSLAHQQFLDIQKQLFEGLDIHFKVLDMPPDELGHPAYRKYDIEVSVTLYGRLKFPSKTHALWCHIYTNKIRLQKSENFGPLDTPN